MPGDAFIFALNAAACGDLVPREREGDDSDLVGDEGELSLGDLLTGVSCAPERCSRPKWRAAFSDWSGVNTGRLVMSLQL